MQIISFGLPTSQKLIDSLKWHRPDNSSIPAFLFKGNFSGEDALTCPDTLAYPSLMPSHSPTPDTPRFKSDDKCTRAPSFSRSGGKASPPAQRKLTR